MTEVISEKASPVKINKSEKTRNNLVEGRIYQMGFTFMIPLKNGDFEEAYPLSCCKDYLNDYVFTINTDIEVNAYGMKTSKKIAKDLIKDDLAYIGVKILTLWGGGDYGKKGSKKNPFDDNEKIVYDHGPYEEDVKRLSGNIQNIQKALNYFDDLFKVKPTTVVIGEDNTYIFSVDKFWVGAAYRISFYTLMLRMFQFWNGEGTPLEFIEKYDNSLDRSLFNKSKPNIEKFLANVSKPIEIDYEVFKGKVFIEGGDSWSKRYVMKIGEVNFDEHEAIHNCGLTGQLREDGYWMKLLK